MPPNWFIALPVPAAPWFPALLAATHPPPGVRLFHAEDLHLTVAFLGPVAEAAAHRAFACAAAWPLGPLDATLAEVHPLGSPRRPSALSAMLAPGEARERLVAAMARVRGAMWAAAGAAPDTRPPLPHITLARPSRSCAPAELAAAVRWGTALPVAGVPIRLAQLALYTRAAERGERLFQKVSVRAAGSAG